MARACVSGRAAERAANPGEPATSARTRRQLTTGPGAGAVTNGVKRVLDACRVPAACCVQYGRRPGAGGGGGGTDGRRGGAEARGWERVEKAVAGRARRRGARERQRASADDSDRQDAISQNREACAAIDVTCATRALHLPADGFSSLTKPARPVLRAARPGEGFAPTAIRPCTGSSLVPLGGFDSAHRHGFLLEYLRAVRAFYHVPRGKIPARRQRRCLPPPMRYAGKVTAGQRSSCLVLDQDQLGALMRFLLLGRRWRRA